MMDREDDSAPGRTLIISDGLLGRLGPGRELLRRALIRLRTARTGSEVLSLAGTSGPGLILLDYHLPGLTADQVCKKVRAHPVLRSVPFIIVGPREPARIGIACRNAGCSLFTPAPADPDRLLSRVADYLGIHPRLEERVPVVLTVSYGTVVSEILGDSINVSVGGILVRAAAPLRLGYFVSLRFRPDREKRPILAPGRIIRVTPTDDGEYDIAVHFLPLPLESVERIQKLVAHHRTTQREAL